MMRVGSLFLALASSAAAQVPPSLSTDADCPLAGPAFPAPSHLSNSTVFAGAIKGFQGQLNNKTLGLKPNDTAWAMAVFSAKENKTLYEDYYTPPIDVGVKKVDGDSIFRLASVSKVFTVWTVLTAIGDKHFNDPITKYIPELADAKPNTTAIYDDIDNVRWEDVTLGDLASQSAGIARDVGLDDLSVNYPLEALEELGFRSLPESELPVCGGNSTQTPCGRKQFFNLLLKKTPVWPSSHSPAYSNIAFELLGLALESITGKDLESTMQESVFDRLGMKHSSFKNPPKSGGVIPGTPLESTWSWDIGMAGNAGGGIYMSAGDMVKAGQAILQSTLLSPAQTRRWFQPRIQTGYLGAAVGAPWEMTYLESPNHRLIPYYNKDGDIGAYHSLIVLSPQHEIGAVILVAGASESNAAMVRTLMKIGLGEIILPAVEEQAKVEAKATFDGSYIDAKTNSSVVIAAGYNGTTGLTVRSLISHGVPMMGPGTSPESPLSSSLGIGNTTRLYPTTLKTVSRKEGGSGRYESRLSFRAAFQQQAIGGTLQDPCILNWANLDGVTYGKQGLDDWVFEMSEDGRAERINIRALRLNLKRKS